jgi:hypothetical protein
MGKEYLLDFTKRYMSIITSEDLECSLRLFQELDAHSVFHLLPTITQPTLVISGEYPCLTCSQCTTESSQCTTE